MVRDIDRRTFVTGAAAIGAAGLAGCTGNGNGNGNGNGDGDGNGDDSGNGNGNGGAGREVSLGVLMPITGDLGSLGGTIRDGALLVRDQLEDAGVDYDINIVEGDTQTDPTAGVSEANSMVNAGVPAVVGPAASNVNFQVAENVFIPNGVVGMSPSSTAPGVTDLDDDGYIFRTCPSDALQGQVMGEVARDRLEAETAATLFLNDDYGQALEAEFVSAFEEDGGTVLNQVSFEPEQPSYSPQLGDALDEDPDTLMVVGFPQSGIQLFRDYYSDYDTGVDIIVPDGLRDSDLPGEVGNDMENVIGTAPLSDGPGSDFFNESYEEAYDRSPGVFNGQAYDAAAVLILANIAAGDNDGTAIRDEIRNVANPDGEVVGPEDLPEAIEMVENGEEINYQGASSSVDFDDNGDMIAVAYEIFQFLDGGIETLDTLDFEAE